MIQINGSDGVIDSVTDNVANITAVSPKSDPSTTSYAEGEWMLIIPNSDVEPQAYNIIYPRVQDSDITHPSINFDGQQDHFETFISYYEP